MTPDRLHGEMKLATRSGVSSATLVILIAATMVGCGGEQRVHRKASGVLEAERCDRLLSRDDAESLAGESLRAPEKLMVSTIAGCKWTATGSDTWIQVLDTSASDWAEGLPGAIEQIKKSDLKLGVRDREKLEAGIRLIEEGGRLDDAEACDLFTVMVVSVQGAPEGSTQVVNYIPSAEDIRAVNGQSCSDGRYRSVALVKPGLKVSASVEQAILAALAATPE